MKLANIPGTVRFLIQSGQLLVNWPAVAEERLHLKPYPDRLVFRNGVVLGGPYLSDLRALFREVWTEHLYTPAGYEIKRGDTVIDVGANIGFFATFAATRAPEVRVYSFEPVASNFTWLRKNIEESGLANVQIFQQAVAGSAGQKPLYIEPTTGMFHSLFNEVAVDNSTRRQETVECTTLDDIFKVNRINCCHLLKLDCEGAELEILTNSSSETLNRVRKVVGEWHISQCSGETFRGVLESRSFQIDYWQPPMFHARNTAPLQS